LPYLFDGETKITETVGIMRYLAKKHDPSLLGKTAAELGRIEMLWDTVSNLKAKCTFPAYMGEKEGEELKDSIAEECQPLLEKIFDVTTGPWLAGETLTWLDFYLAEVIDYMEGILDQRFVALVPASHEYLERFMALEKV